MHDLSSYQLGVLALGAIAFGVYLLVKGGDWTVDAAVGIARRAGLSTVFIGATIVAFGTSVPELFTSVTANLEGFPGIALGNVVGSNIANVLLVIGASAVVFRIKGGDGAIRVDIWLMLFATTLLVAGLLYGLFPRWSGGVMFALLVVWVFQRFRHDKLPPGAEIDEEAGADEPALRALGWLTAGIVALAVGAELLVQGAVAAGDAIGVPEAVIGLTVVAFGTSLPEMATCISAAMRKHTGMIVGNVVGSNIFNVLSIVGLTALIKPLEADAFGGFDVWFLVGVTVLFAAWLIAEWPFGRRIGAMMTAAYLLFVAVQYQSVVAG